MVQGDETLDLTLGPVALDNTINIAEKEAGFTISGNTGSETGVTVTVTVGSTTLTDRSVDDGGNGLWEVDVPADASYITGTSVAVRVTASKAGFLAPDAVERTVAVDLVAPETTYGTPGPLQVGVAMTALNAELHAHRHRVLRRGRACPRGSTSARPRGPSAARRTRRTPPQPRRR